ncbi:hypothetical protein KAH27_00075 [bacterium]|nr:hypothetical protein [bacterium]
MKDNINKLLLTRLKKANVPPIEFWRLFACRNNTAILPPNEKWEKVWKEFVKIYRSDNVTIYFSGSSKKQLNLPAIKAYFRVEWDKSRRTGRESISALEEKWWRLAGAIMPKILMLRHIKLPESGMHLDIFWPKAMVALEVQGEQHWRSTAVFGGAKNFAKRQERDARKRNICARLGIKLIEISNCTPVLRRLNELSGLLR